MGKIDSGKKIECMYSLSISVVAPYNSRSVIMIKHNEAGHTARG